MAAGRADAARAGLACGRRACDILDGTMSWSTCWTAPTPEAHLVKGFLETRGVPCLLLGEGAGLYPVPGFALRVLVPDEWLPVARKMLTTPRPRRPRAAGLLRRIHG